MKTQVSKVLTWLAVLSAIAGTISLVQRGLAIPLSELHQGLLAYYREFIWNLHAWVPKVLPHFVHEFADEHFANVTWPDYLDMVAISVLLSQLLMRAGLAAEHDGVRITWRDRLFTVVLNVILIYSGLAVAAFLLIVVLGPVFYALERDTRADARLFIFGLVKASTIYAACLVLFFMTNLVSVPVRL